MNVFSYAFNVKELVILFAVLQAVFLVVVLLRIPTQNLLPNRLLSGLLICLSVLLLEYVWVYTHGYKSAPHLLGFSLPVCLVISPLYYLYALTLLQKKFNWRVAVHGLPILLGLLLLMPFYVTDATTKVVWVEQVIGAGMDGFPTYCILVASFISVQMLVYFFSTYALVENYETKVKEESADVGVLTIAWVKTLSVSFCLFAVFFYLSAMEYLMLPTGHDAPANVLVMGVVGFILMLAYVTYQHPDLFALYEPGKLPAPEELKGKPKYQNTLLSAQQVDSYKQQLVTAMEENKYYLNGELRLAQLAEALGIPAHHLSQVINVAFAQSFFDFINRYRVVHAKALICEGSDLKQGVGDGNILDIALASGFNSKASFNRVFKRETGVTPSNFLANQSKSPLQVGKS